MLLQPFRLLFLSNLTQGDALGYCNYEPFGLVFSKARRARTVTAQGIALGSASFKLQPEGLLFLSNLLQYKPFGLVFSKARRAYIATAQGIALGKIRKRMQPERLLESL